MRPCLYPVFGLREHGREEARAEDLSCMRDAALYGRSKASGGEAVSPNKEIQNIVDRMRMFFVGTGMKSASKDTVIKWAAEIEAQLRAQRTK